MWMMPTGRPSSTTNSAVMLEELIISSAALASSSGDTVFGPAVMISPVRRDKQPVAHVPAQIAVGDDPGKPAVLIDHAETAKGLLGHHHDGLGHRHVARSERQAIAFVHEVADEFQPGAELAAGVQNLEVAGGEALAFEQRDGEAIAERKLHRWSRWWAQGRAGRLPCCGEAPEPPRPPWRACCRRSRSPRSAARRICRE